MSTSGETPRMVPVDPADQIRADIIQTRADLGETVDRLAARLDVKARTREQVDKARGKAGELSSSPRARWATAAAGALVAMLVVMRYRARRRP